MKFLAKIVSETSRNLFYQHPEASNTPENLSIGMDKVGDLVNETKRLEEKTHNSTEYAEDRIGFAQETLQATKAHYEEAFTLTPEVSGELDQQLDHELLSIKKKEAEEVGRLQQETQDQLANGVIGGVDSITGIKPAGWESNETPGSAEAVIDTTNPNTNIADTVLRQGNVSESASIMKS